MSDSNEKNDTIKRRDFIVLTSAAMAAVGAGSLVWPIVNSLNPSKDVLALASTEVNLSPIVEGQTIKVLWRGKPVFIKHMTQTEIDEAKSIDLSKLKDPQSFEQRIQKGHEKWLVMIGVCTHLGCIPIADKGDFDGFFCPCHGSHYDVVGRIMKGPAPVNLVIPEFKFIEDQKIVIG